MEKTISLNLFRFDQSLRARVMGLMGILFVFLFLAIVASILVYIYRTEQDTWRARQAEAAQSAASTVENYLMQNENVLSWLDRYGYDEVRDHPESLQELMAENPAFIEILFVDENGIPTLGASKDQPTLANQFTILQSEWFRLAMAGEQVYTRVQTSPQDVSYTIFAMPSEHGGVLAAQIQMDLLWDTVAKIRFGEEGSIYLVNQLGQVIAHPNREIVLSNQSIEDTQQFQAIMSAPNQKWSGDTENFKGVRVVGVSAPVTETSWVVISELPWQEAYASTIWASIFIPVGLMILISITILIFQRVFYTQVMEPLNELQRGTIEIGNGNLTHRIEVARDDELGQVVTGFNSMTSDLQRQRNDLKRYADELEMRVQERTNQLTVANERLTQQVSEKETLLKEIHHRVKNNLQVISSLLNLQANQVQGTSALQALRDSQTRVKSMALIHEKLYQSKNLARIHFGEYVQSLAADLFRSYQQRNLGAVQLSVAVEEVYLGLNQAVPCGLIFNELMTNALKYAFPDGRQGILRVELHYAPENEITLVVADNGVGLPVEFDMHNTKSLGWQLVNNLTRQLDGSLHIDRTEGTRCSITFIARLEDA